MEASRRRHEFAEVVDDQVGSAGQKAVTSSHRGPPQNATQRRRIVSAFLDKFALPERLEQDLEMPGWTPEMVAEMTTLYDEDVGRIAAMPEITFLRP